MKSALAIGGANALGTTLNLYGLSGAATAESDPVTVAERQNRQHAWNDFLADNGGSNLRHHLLLFLDYCGYCDPKPEDRAAVEGALRQLEAAFEWSNEGLLFTVGYSRAYFDRFETELPSGVDLRRPEKTIEAMTVGDEDPTPDPAEVAIHLGSDNAANLLAAEEALWGFPGADRDEINGVEVEHTFEGVFEKPTSFPERRTGFVGSGLPKEEIQDVDEDTADQIHEDAPLSMGFKSGFADNLPDETAVTILHDQTLGGKFEGPGVFSQGTIQQVSKLDLDLDAWYDQSKEERIHRMFSPHHTESDVGYVGENLGSTTGTDDLPLRDHRVDEEDIAQRTHEDAESGNLVGHAQKLARARFDLDLRRKGAERDAERPLDTSILRRDFDTTDQDRPGLHFVSLMRFNGYIVYVRKAMNGVGFDPDDFIPTEPGEVDGSRISHDDVDVPRENDGFLDFVTAKMRGNFLVPPLTMRALPPARAIRPEIDVQSDDVDLSEAADIDVVVPRTSEFDPKQDLDLGTVRFGSPASVDTGRGASPVSTGRPVNGDSIEDADLVLTFPVDESGIEEGTTKARLFGKTRNGHPVLGTDTLTVSDSDS